MRVQLIFLVLVMLAACGQASLDKSRSAEPSRIISLDYCADQYVLKFAQQDRILAVSPDADLDFSYMRAAAEGVRQVRPRAEDVLALNPDLIVRSYGGGPGASALFEAAGIPVLQVGWASDLQAVGDVTLEMASGLGAPEEGKRIVADMRARLAAMKTKTGEEILYLTSGGVTTGPGSLVHEMLLAAGHANFEAEAGWRDVPLEKLVYDKPDAVAYARFETHVTPWSRARHPLVRNLLTDQPVVSLQGAWTSCGGWFLIEAVEALAEGGG